MAESFIQVNSGTGPKAHTFNRTIGANGVEDDIGIPGEPYLPAYVISSGSVSAATSGDHLLAVMAGASLNVASARIFIRQRALAGAVNQADIAIVRLTTAGTGGTVVTPQKVDNGDAAAGCTAMTIPTVKGAEGAQIGKLNVGVVAAQPIDNRNQAEYNARPDFKKLIIPSGTANGFAVKIVTGIASLTFDIEIWVYERNFL